MKLIGVSKNFNKSNKAIEALNNISYQFLTNNKFYAITGHSGSGKSTLIQILGMLDDVTSGMYLFKDKNVAKLNESQKAKLRNKNIGFIFQNYYLDSNLKAYENVMIPMYINTEIENKDRKKIALELLCKVGLTDRINHYPHELSGGEQQRVAIARALANDPDIILADEPTGSLDEKNEQIIFSLLKKISESGKCVIVVSHSSAVKNYCTDFLEMENGKIKGVEYEK